MEVVDRERVVHGGRKGWQDVRVVRFGGQSRQEGEQKVVVCDPLSVSALAPTLSSSRS